MKKNQKNPELNIDMKLVDERARQIGQALEGVKFPEILSILGTVIVELEYNAAVQKVDAAPVLLDWLEKVGTEVYKARMGLFNEADTKELN